MATPEEKQSDFKPFSFSVILSQVFGILTVVLMGIWMGNYNFGAVPAGFHWGTYGKDKTLEEKMVEGKTFRYHPLFMTIGFAFFQGEALLAFRLYRHEKKIFGKLLHGICHAIAICLIVAALVADFQFKKYMNLKNMTTPHSWLGMALVIVYMMQFVVGFCSFLFPKANENLRKWYLPIHTFSGLAIFSCTIAQMVSGISNYVALRPPGCLQSFRTQKDDEFCSELLIANFLGLAFIFYGISIVYIVAFPEYRRRPLPDGLD